MIEYLAVLGLASLAAITGSRRAPPALAALAILYWVLLGWRHRVGMDWNNYVVILDRDAGKDLVTLMTGAEPGFGLLIWLSNFLGGHTFLNVISAGVFCLGLFAFARRCREPFLAIAVATPYLVMVVAMSATRQAIALGIIFYLFARWYDLRVGGKVLAVLAATMFHFSALFIFVFVILQSKLSGFMRLVAAGFVAALVFGSIVLAPERVGFYTESYVIGRDVVESPGALSHVLLLAIPAIVYFAVQRWWRPVHGRSTLIHHLAIASILAVPALLISSTGVDRLSLYFWPMAMYVWAGLPALTPKPEARILIRALALAASAAQLVLWLLYSNSSRAWLPYQNSLF